MTVMGREGAVRWRDEAVREREGAVRWRDARVRERDAAVRERDEAVTDGEGRDLFGDASVLFGDALVRGRRRSGCGRRGRVGGGYGGGPRTFAGVVFGCRSYLNVRGEVGVDR